MSDNDRGRDAGPGAAQTPSLPVRLFIVGFPLLVAAGYLVLADPWWFGALTVLAATASTAFLLKNWR